MSIQNLLMAWGRGLAVDSAPNGYPSQAPTASLMAKGNISLPPLNDDDQIRIDAVVSAMKLTKPDHYEVICYAYIARISDTRIGRKVRRGKKWVTDTRHSAEGYLEAKLEDLLP